MRLKPARYDELYDAEERLIARMAARARLDTIWGGAAGLMYAERLYRMGGTDLRYVVSDVYSASTGNHHGAYEAWECPECGSARLGTDDAYNCCNHELEEA
jgi:hypothetical protein